MTDWNILYYNIFLFALIMGGVGIIFRLIFQRNNSPSKWFVLEIVAASIAGSETLAFTLYFTGTQETQWWMVPALLVASLVFPKLPDLIKYLMSGKPVTFAALWQLFLDSAAEEFSPVLKEIIQFLVDNWSHFNLAELQAFLKGKELEYIQQQLAAHNQRLQQLQAESTTTTATT